MSSTAIVVITTHGNTISQDDKQEFDSFMIPPGINIVKYSNSAPGICSIINKEDMQDIIKTYIEPSIESILTASTPNDIKILIETTMADDVKIHSELMAELLKKYGTGKGEDDQEKDMQDYIRTFVRGNTTNIINGQMTNKFFSTKGDDKVSEYYNRLLLVTPQGNIDLLEQFGKSELSLKSLITILTRTGYTRIVLFDFSCSGSDLNDGDLRTARNNALKTGAWGGRKRKNTQKMKRRIFKRKKTHKRKTLYRR
jgi:hypothetical protein